MKSMPLRARITMLVLAAAAAAIAAAVALGGITSVSDSIAVNTLEASSEALDQADEQLADIARSLQVAMVEEAEANGAGPFARWSEFDGPSRTLFASDGQTELGDDDFDLVGPLTMSGIQRCRAATSVTECRSPDAVEKVPAWAVDTLERSISASTIDVAIVVHGFVVSNGDDNAMLVRLETDIFESSDVDVGGGIEDIAAVVLPILLLGLGALTWFSLGRVLGPVAAIQEQVDQIGAGNLDQRVPVPEADDELRSLAETMNRMLDRLQGASDSQRQFISDASHELRSPITATGATIEVAKADPDNADWPQVAAIVEEENTRLSRLVDDLLLLARMDEENGTDGKGRAGEMWAVDLDEICLVEADRPHPVAVSVHVVDPARVTGSVSALSRAIRNLVENAAAHASSQVNIEVRAGNGVAEVRVGDDGPGVPPEFEAQIFERFVRIEEARTRNGSGGAGLGLAIARQIASNHGGRLELVENSSDGATFALSLPLA